MAAHRYWRMYITGNCGNNAFGCIDELEFASSFGGSNLCSGGTAISSGDFGGYPASRAFNGVKTTGQEWFSAGALPVWIGYDFGSGNDKDIVEARWVYAYNSGGNYRPDAFRFDYSDNGSSWTTAWDIPKLFGPGNVSQSAELVFRDPARMTYGAGEHSFWRIRASKIQTDLSDYFGVEELEFATSLGGANVATSGATVDTSGHPIANGQATSPFIYWPRDAFGGAYGVNPRWYGPTLSGASSGGVATVATPDWIGYRFNEPKAIREIRVRAQVGSGAGAPRDFTLDYSDDGVNWTTARTITGEPAWSSGEWRDFEIDAPSSSRPGIIWFD